MSDMLPALGGLVRDAMLCVDADQRITYVNPVAAKLLDVQWPSPAVEGKPIGELIPEAAHQSVSGTLSAVLESSEPASLWLPRDDTHPLGGHLCQVTVIPSGAALVLTRPDSGAHHARLLADAARALSTSVTSRSVHATVARIATGTLGASDSCLFLANTVTRRVSLVQFGDPRCGDQSMLVRHFWKWHTGQVMTTGDACFIGDRASPTGDGEEAAEDRQILAGYAACAILPLGGEPRKPSGVLLLAYENQRSFDEDERRLLGDFAIQVSLAMRNAELVADLERRAARLAAVALAQQAIPKARMDEVYTELLRATASVVDAPVFAVLAATDADATTFAPRFVMVDGRIIAVESVAPSSVRDSVAAEACRGESPLVERPPLWSWSAAVAPEPGREWRRAAAGLMAPIRHGTRVLGVLHIQSYDVTAYAAEDAGLMSIIASQAGAALEMARLFAAEQQERELAEASAEVARLALGAASVDEVADELLATVDRLAPGSSKALGVLTPDGMLHYTAASGDLAGYRGLRRPEVESLARLLRPAGITEIADLSRAVRPAPSIEPPPMAAMLVPLLARERVIGMIVITTPAGSQHVAGEHRELLQRLAAPMALALDMLMLHEEDRRRLARERMLAAALATMDQPVLVLRPDGRVRYANEAALREYGYRREDISGLLVDRLTSAPAESARAGRAAVDIAIPEVDPALLPEQPLTRAGPRRLSGIQQAVASTPLCHYRRDGSAFPVSITRAAIRDDDGELVGEVLCIRNLTDERRIAEQLRQHEKLAALGSLVAGVAHELNNPLTGISAFAQLLLEEPLHEEQVESVRLIKREADRAVGVIRDLLLFSRKTEAQLDRVDVNALVQLTVRLRTYTLRAESIGVTLDLDPAAPHVVADEQRLQQVLLNLLVNAEYAMHNVPERQLTLRTRGEGDDLVVEVMDTGSGIDQETQRHIFEPFYTTKPPGVGTGLGLSVSYGIVQAHGGGISVDSVPGGGTTFRITLPAHRPPSGPDAR